MRQFSILLALVASLAIALPAAAASNKLRTEVGGDGQAYVFSSSSARITVGGPDSGYAAVYTTAKSPAGKALADIDMGFRITVDGQSGYVTGGAPRLTIPIDTNGDGKWDVFATMDWNSCQGTATGGMLDQTVIMSTENANCTVYLNSGGSYANWDAFAQANPSWRVASAGSSTRPFVIVDWAPTNVTLTAIDLS